MNSALQSGQFLSGAGISVIDPLLVRSGDGLSGIGLTPMPLFWTPTLRAVRPQSATSKERGLTFSIRILTRKRNPAGEWIAVPAGLKVRPKMSVKKTCAVMARRLTVVQKGGPR